MKARSKKEFLEQLGYELNRIGIEDSAEIFADFEEHFADSAMQGLSEAETAERLGDVKEIARSYLNLESSRLNSIVARDVEHKKGVSLTKPGYSVPADLNLLKGRDAINSDCIRSYTPEHFSEEIYPNMNGSNASNIGFSGGFNGNTNVGGPAGTVGENAFSQNAPGAGFSANAGGASGAGVAPGAGAANTSAAGSMPGANGRTVADAFSNAGRAAIDAAKVTGQAIADAFGQSNVKDAVVGAGKSAAEAVKTAGHSAADAVKRAKAEHGRRASQHTAQQTAQQAAQQADAMPNSAPNAVPHPNDSFRANTNNSRRGSIPIQNVKAKTSGKPYKLIDVSNMQPHLNVGKFIWALVLDCLLWSWLVPAFAGVIFGGCFGGTLGLIGQFFIALFGMGGFRQFYFISRVFLAIGFASLVIILFNIGMMLIRAFLKLFLFIINMHIRAIYNL